LQATNDVGWNEFEHAVIDHAVGYVDGEIQTNSMENYWSLFKRGINGTYVSVKPFHLFRYLDEQGFRFNNRKMDVIEGKHEYLTRPTRTRQYRNGMRGQRRPHHIQRFEG
jgi:hypothetical protein